MKRNYILFSLGAAALGFCVWYCLYADYLNKFLINERFANLVFSLCLSYIASLIFYLVVYFFPEKRAKENILKSTVDNVEFIQFYMAIINLYLSYLCGFHKQYITGLRSGDNFDLSHHAEHFKLTKKFARIKRDNEPISPGVDIMDAHKKIRKYCDNVKELNYEISFDTIKKIERLGVIKSIESALSLEGYMRKQHPEFTHQLTPNSIKKLRTDIVEFNDVRLELDNLSQKLHAKLGVKNFRIELPVLTVESISFED